MTAPYARRGPLFRGEPTGVALYNRVAAVLRDHATVVPLRPMQIAELLGPHDLWSCECGHGDICEEDSHWRYLGQRLLKADALGPHLRRLEREGLAERHTPDPRPGRPRYWRWTGPTAP